LGWLARFNGFTHWLANFNGFPHRPLHHRDFSHRPALLQNFPHRPARLSDFPHRLARLTVTVTLLPCPTSEKKTETLNSTDFRQLAAGKCLTVTSGIAPRPSKWGRRKWSAWGRPLKRTTYMSRVAVSNLTKYPILHNRKMQP
jgi:hypothetical protein